MTAMAKKHLQEAELSWYYDNKILPYLDDIQRMWVRDGLSWEAMADALGIEYDVFYEIWQSDRFQELRAIVRDKRSKEIRAQQVEDMLYRMAVGYDRKVKAPFKVKVTETHTDKRGKRVSTSREIIKYAEYTEHLAPNVEAAKFWLCNRKGGEWANDSVLTLKAQQQPSEEREVDSVKVVFVDPDTPEQKARVEAIDAKVTAIEASEAKEGAK